MEIVQLVSFEKQLKLLKIKKKNVELSKKNFKKPLKNFSKKIFKNFSKQIFKNFSKQIFKNLSKKTLKIFQTKKIFKDFSKKIFKNFQKKETVQKFSNKKNCSEIFQKKLFNNFQKKNCSEIFQKLFFKKKTVHKCFKKKNVYFSKRFFLISFFFKKFHIFQKNLKIVFNKLLKCRILNFKNFKNINFQMDHFIQFSKISKEKSKFFFEILILGTLLYEERGLVTLGKTHRTNQGADLIVEALKKTLIGEANRKFRVDISESKKAILKVENEARRAIEVLSNKDTVSIQIESCFEGQFHIYLFLL